MEMPDYVKTALDFYEFDYFGCKLPKDNIKELVKICARRAYIDLCRTITYNKNINENYHALFREKIGEYIFTQIEEYRLLESEKDTIFNSRHSTICENIVNMARSAKTEYGDDILTIRKIKTKKADKSNCNSETKQSFYYGHAQKWLNMTLKYMWMAGALKDRGNVETYLHIPVDRYIIKAVLKNEDVYLPLKSGKKQRLSAEVDDVVAWSTWNFEKYFHFQESVRQLFDGKQLPLVWENEKWIEFAPEFREKETQKKDKDFDEWKKDKKNVFK